MSETQSQNKIVLGIGLMAMLLGVLSLVPYITANGLTSVSDFSAFFTAGKMAAAGTPDQAYSLDHFRQTYNILFPGKPDGYGWLYPPHFLLPHMWLATFSHPVAKLAWLVATFGIYAYGMSKVIPKRIYWLLILFAPAALMNLHAAQTGFLTTGLLAIYAANHINKRSQVAGGVAVGFLTIKPHLWVMLPVHMIVYRQWRAIVAAIVTTLLLVAFSLAVFGMGPWTAMIESSLAGYASIHDGDDVLLGKMSTIAALTTALGLAKLKVVAQLCTLLACSAGLWWLVRRNADGGLATAFAVVATFVIAPHNMVYDHTILVLPLMLAFPHAVRQGLWALPVLLIAYFWAFLTVFIPVLTVFPCGSLTALALLVTLFALAFQSHDADAALA